jgi:hypothetical protein
MSAALETTFPAERLGGLIYIFEIMKNVYTLELGNHGMRKEMHQMPLTNKSEAF